MIKKSSIELFIESKVLPQYQTIVDKFRKLIKSEFPDIKEEMRGGTEKYYGVPVYRYHTIIITLSPTKKVSLFLLLRVKSLKISILYSKEKVIKHSI